MVCMNNYFPDLSRAIEQIKATAKNQSTYKHSKHNEESDFIQSILVKIWWVWPVTKYSVAILSY